jgi:hypothetical protein
MKNIISTIAILASLLLAMPVSAQVLVTNTSGYEFSNEFWISANATGYIYGETNIYPTNTFIGTLQSPLDGSTQVKFDSNMNALPPNSTIHLLAGTYQTAGSPGVGWVKSGEKIIGSGIDVTIVQMLSSASYGGTVFLNYNYGGNVSVTNAEISDLTADANGVVGSGNAHNGIEIFGTRNAVRRVKVTGTYCPDPTNEVGGIGLNNYYLPFMSPNPDYAELAINNSWAYNILIDGNYVNGAIVGVYSDTGGYTNVIVTDNTFKNVFQGVRMAPVNSPQYNMTIAFNNIALTPTTTYQTAAFWFSGGTSTNVFIFGNTMGFTGPGASTAVAVTADNLTGLVFANNFVDSLMASNQAASLAITNVTNLSMYNNNDLFGNYLPSLNIPTVGGTEVSSFGLSLISSAEASSALTNLGLPSNPATVITNSQTGVTLSGTFSGNGNGLTNVFTTSTLPIAASFVLQITNDTSEDPHVHEFHNYGIATNTYSYYFSNGPHLFITNWFSSPMQDNLYGVGFVNPNGTYGTNMNYTYMSGTTNFLVFTTFGPNEALQTGYAYVVIYR